MNYIKRNKKSLIIFLSLIVFGILFASAAQGLEANWPAAPGGKALTDDSTLVDFVEYCYRWGVLLGGLAAFMSLIYAGFRYLTSVGDPMKMKDARSRIISAILGLVLLLSTFIALNTLNPELTVLQAPTTTVGGFGVGTFGEGPSNEPCHEVKLYKGKNYNPSTLWGCYSDGSPGTSPCPPVGMPTCGLFVPEPCVNVLQVDSCMRIGDPGWPFVGWFGTDVPIKSIKINGGCVINIYEGGGCDGAHSTISMSDPNLSGYIQEQKHSLRIIDRSPPSPPECHIVTPATNIKKDITGNTYQADLDVDISDMNKNGYATLYILYGTASSDGIGYKFDQVFADPENPHVPPHPWPIVLEQPGVSTYTVTGLAANTTYYWKVKAVGDQGGKCEDPPGPTSSYSFTTGP